MSSVIERQIDALRESVVEQAQKPAPDDLEELVGVSLAVYDALQELCHRVDREIAAGKRVYDLAAARAVWKGFVSLNDLLRAVSGIASRAAGEGRKVEGAERLERAVIECGLIASVSPDRAAAADAKNTRP